MDINSLINNSDCESKEDPYNDSEEPLVDNNDLIFEED